MAQPKKIDLFIIGMPKAGTTALLRQLEQSPITFAHKQREMFYFHSNDEYRRGWDYACEKYFPGYDSGCILLAKNVKQAINVQSMQRLKNHSPAVKCIIMLRNPVSRAYSAYNYAVTRGAEGAKTFEEALAAEDARFERDNDLYSPVLYLRNSTYAKKIEAAQKIFGKGQVLVIYHEDFKANAKLQLKLVEDFMGRQLLEDSHLSLKTYNSAAGPRFKLLAKLMYWVLNSQNPVKKIFRLVLPHSVATKTRHAVLNFNKVKAVFPPVASETRIWIERKTEDDRQALLKLVGRCPW